MNRSRLQSSVGIGNPGLLTPDRAGSVLLDEPAVEQGPLMEEDRSSTDSEDSEEEVSALWQYGLWSFQTGGTKLERFLP